MKKNLLPLVALLCFIYYHTPVKAHKPVKTVSSTHEVNKLDSAFICLSFEKIYDIDFHDHEFKIDFWCSLTYPKNSTLNCRDQLYVADAKEMTITTTDSSVVNGFINLLLKIKCKMFYKWDVEGYPFDKQHLKIILYNAGKAEDKFKFIADGHGLHNSNGIDLENGWKINCSDSVIKAEPFSVPFGESKYHSSVAFNLDIHRMYSWGLFFKLFIGMYVACIVAFLALFIDTKKHFEPRFGLLVGALFAAIANKYIVESILPESPLFNLVDDLHALSFFSITIIILFSVMALYLNRDEIPASGKNKAKLLLWANHKAGLLLFILYLSTSSIFIIHALVHKHGEPALSIDKQTQHQHSNQS